MYATVVATAIATATAIYTTVHAARVEDGHMDGVSSKKITPAKTISHAISANVCF